MQKYICTILLALTLLGCGNDLSNKELNAYILKAKMERINDHSSVGTVSQTKIYFSKGFWNAFINKFPVSTSKIFRDHLLHPQDPVSENNTTFLVAELDSIEISSLRISLPKNFLRKEVPAGSTQNNDIGSDQSQTNEKTTADKKIKLYLARDYSRFMKLLKDSTINQLQIFYTKDFLKQNSNEAQ